MNGNLGTTSLRRRKREGDAMRAFDALPPALRRWLSEAALPWSPASCRRIWLRARSRGESVDAVLARLERAQRQTLARDTALPPGHPGFLATSNRKARSAGGMPRPI